MYNQHNHDPFALDAREFLPRLQAHAALVLGYHPSSRQLTTALIQYVMKGRETDTATVMELARRLFPTGQEGSQCNGES